MNLLGLMSGTSVDSIDAALIHSNEKDQLLLHCEFPWKKTTREKILALIHNPKTDLEKVLDLHYEIGHAFAEAAAKMLKTATQKKLLSARNPLALVGSHGQTIFHSPAKKQTWQAGEASLIVAKTGVTTVSDFRVADTAFGGDGAPLAPYYHKRMLERETNGSIFLNLGGISNYTYVNKSNLFSLDAGPANCWMDLVIQREGKAYDKDGEVAAVGSVNQALLRVLKNDPAIRAFRALRAPKSTGRELFSAARLEKITKKFSRVTTPDLLRTLLQFSVDLLQESMEREILKKGQPLKKVFVAGGGASNRLFLHTLQVHLPMADVHKSDVLGVSSKSLESQAFAFFARAAVEGLPISFPRTTGCSEPAICGKISPGANWRDLVRA